MRDFSEIFVFRILLYIYLNLVLRFIVLILRISKKIFGSYPKHLVGENYLRKVPHHNLEYYQVFENIYVSTKSSLLKSYICCINLCICRIHVLIVLHGLCFVKVHGSSEREKSSEDVLLVLSRMVLRIIIILHCN